MGAVSSLMIMFKASDCIASNAAVNTANITVRSEESQGSCLLFGGLKQCL